MATPKRPSRAGKPEGTPATTPAAKAKPAPRAGSRPANPAPATGRPPVISRTIQDSVVKALTAGNFVEVACAYAGIHKDTYYSWLKRGSAERERIDRGAPLEALAGVALRRELDRREVEKPFLDFSDAVKRAQAESEVGLTSILYKAATESWQAGAWLLERKHPDRWGVKRKVEVEIASEVRAQLEKGLDRLEAAVERGELDAATYDRVLAVLADMEGPEGGGGDPSQGGAG
jgi:hypothetical protein